MKLKHLVMLMAVLMWIAVMVMGYCKGKEDEINWKKEQAIAHSYQERPIYYGR